MNLFETVKSAVTVKQAAEYYGCKVNRGDMICCPFHDDRHPSMKLNRDYFYCFGCGATGDVIDFVARLFGLSSYEAAKKLAYDFGIDPDKPPAAMALKKPYPLAQAFRNDEIHCQRVLCDYLHLLERWKVEYAPQSPEDELDDRFVEACHMIEYVNDLLDVLMFAELKQRVKAVDMLLKDGTITALEQRLRFSPSFYLLSPSFYFFSLPPLISFLPPSSINFVLILGKVLVVIRKKCTFA